MVRPSHSTAPMLPQPTIEAGDSRAERMRRSPGRAAAAGLEQAVPA